MNLRFKRKNDSSLNECNEDEGPRPACIGKVHFRLFRLVGNVYIALSRTESTDRLAKRRVKSRPS